MALPLVGMGVGYGLLFNQRVRELRMGYLPRFRSHFDDYLQFSPLALQVGLRTLGVEGNSASMVHMLVADAAAVVAMAGVVHFTKSLAHVERPDGSSDNSFPSGHTSMAFTAATLLYLEYAGRGKPYSWLTVGSYSLAFASGVGRVLNNRHWVGDVVAGAGIGLLSGAVGYQLSDWIFGRKRHLCAYCSLLPDNQELSVMIPTTYGSSLRNSSLGRGRFSFVSMGFGVRWRYSSPGYLLRVSCGAEYYRFELKDKSLGVFRTRCVKLNLGWGRELSLWQDRFSVDLLGGVGIAFPCRMEAKGGDQISVRGGLSPRIQISPRWHFSRHMSFMLDAGWALSNSAISFYRRCSTEAVYMSAPRWSLGSSLVLSF